MQQLQEVEQTSDLEPLRRRLASRSPKERAAAEAALDQLAVSDLVRLMAIEQKNRSNRKKWIMYGVLTYIAFMVILAVTLHNHHFLTMFNGFFGLIAVAAAFSQPYKTAALKLAKYDDVAGVAPLIDALEISDMKIQSAVREGLTPSLKRLRASDSHLIGPSQRRVLRAQLSSQPGRKTREKMAPFIVSILKALEQVGDESFLGVVQEISSGRGFGVAPEVREAAEDCLPALMQRIENERLSHGLLRASCANLVGDPNALLRPAESSDLTQPEELLRASMNN